MRVKQAKKVKTLLDRHPEVGKAAKRCLLSQRWGGSAVLMVLDASFTSTGVNYFAVVVPRVKEFRERFLSTYPTLRELSSAREEKLYSLWGNRRSWRAGREIASCLARMAEEENLDDREALRRWASKAKLESWQGDSIGGIRGVGLNTFQYLRMMGGVDTAMPDRIVKRFLEGLLGEELKEKDVVVEARKVAEEAKCTSVELCFLAWMAEYEGSRKAQAYAQLLEEI